jgi:cation diffusion facilitator CzcD-associated flavoprotein CzcO
MPSYSTHRARPDLFTDVLIAGAGFSGLGMAIKLRQAAMESFLIIEKNNDIGGTWWANRYPGCACDIPAHLYSFSFDRNPDWSRMYAPREEIHAYLKSCAQRHGVMPQVRLNTELREAVWDEAGCLWRVTTSDGSKILARILISAVGVLRIPRCPEITGLEHFAGASFHSTDWDDTVDLSGKNVAVIGTGASAIQIVPEIASQPKRLYLFQRTPPWILPKLDFAIPKRWKERFRHMPGLGWLFRQLLFCRQELTVLGLIGPRWIGKRGEKMALDHLRKQVKDPVLRAALTPKYEIGCKRVLLSNDFYPALQRPNVELVTAGIQEIREHSILTADGKERAVDAIVFGTGFRATEMLPDTRIVGRDGLEIHDAWKERVSAYMGMTVSGFPNFFILLGPNTGLGHNSVVLMIEAQVGYIMSCLRMMRRKKAAVMELRPERQHRFAEHLRKRLARTVWQTGGCVSWYQDPKTGENPSIWPGSVVEYMQRTRSVSAADYNLRGNIRQAVDPQIDQNAEQVRSGTGQS